MSEIFISYSHADQAFVVELVRFLRSSGVSVWFDKEDLKGGQKWADIIEDEIPSSKIFLICLSDKALGKRGFFHTEQQLAHKAAMSVPSDEIFIVPVMLDDCEIPRQLRQYHVISLNSANGPNNLIQSIAYALDRTIEVSNDDCDRLLEELHDHIGTETTSLDFLEAGFRKGLRSPVDNINLIEQIANSSDRRKLELLAELRTNDILSFAEHAAIDMAIVAIRSGQKIKGLYDAVTKSEKKKISQMSVLSGDPKINAAMRGMKFWRFISRKDHPQYSNVEEKLAKVFFEF